MTKTPFCSKNPATIAKGFSSAGSGHGTQGAVGEVVCPLLNSDGSQCRKKCIGVSWPTAHISLCVDTMELTSMALGTRVLRTSRTVQYVNTSDERTQTTGFQSFLPARKHLQRWSAWCPETVPATTTAPIPTPTPTITAAA